MTQSFASSFSLRFKKSCLANSKQTDDFKNEIYLINDILIQVKFVENPCLQNWWASMRSSLLSARLWLSSTALQSTAAFFSASWTFPKTNKLKLLFSLFNSSLVDFFANFQRIFANYSALTVKILSKAVSYSNSTDIQLFLITEA